MRTVRRMAAQILGVGENKVWIDPDRLNDASSALTKDDVRVLIGKGVIKALPVRGSNRIRGKFRDERRRKGRRRGLARRKGAKGARDDPKERWVATIRAQREYLKKIKPLLVEGAYRKLYLKVKGGQFKSRVQLIHYIKDNNLVK